VAGSVCGKSSAGSENCEFSEGRCPGKNLGLAHRKTIARVNSALVSDAHAVFVMLEEFGSTDAIAYAGIANARGRPIAVWIDKGFRGRVDAVTALADFVFIHPDWPPLSGKRTTDFGDFRSASSAVAALDEALLCFAGLTVPTDSEPGMACVGRLLSSPQTSRDLEEGAVRHTHVHRSC
jgi:hypothetical protein